MSISDTIRAIGFILPIHPQSYCIAQAFLIEFGSISGLLWTSIIAFCLYCVVVQEINNIKKYHMFMILIGYILPIFIAALPQMTNSYGEDNGWCWIKQEYYRFLWRIGGFYAIMVIVLFFNAICYYKIIREIRYEIELLTDSDHEISDKQKLFSRFRMYPLVIVICYLPLLCKRIYEIFNDDSIYWLTIFSVITTSAIGILNAIVYGLTDSVKEILLDTLRKLPFSRRASRYENFDSLPVNSLI
ncbi:hypothetical protein SteCoe_10138 [Stentor coeruleus]|uniref:G-protein coupled receptors family 2 profile 2 domain-containing protein n=1 Tax=Stentor coeruleus TaxID=5963 RepID=A0A1R2CG92_9CILI|nr:hypothetical protein SteCoe_10138 [Stentor coeruleus]